MKKITVSVPLGIVGLACNAIVQAYNTLVEGAPVEVDLWTDPYDLADKTGRVILAGRNVAIEDVKEYESSKTNVIIFDNSNFNEVEKTYIKKVVSQNSIINPNVPIPTMLYNYFSRVVFRKVDDPHIIDQWKRVGVAVQEMSDYLDGKDVYYDDKFENLTKPSMRGIYLNTFQMIDWIEMKSEQFDQLLSMEKDPGTNQKFTELIKATYSAIAAESDLFYNNMFAISPLEYDSSIYAGVCPFELKYDKFTVGKHFKDFPYIKFVIDFNVSFGRIRIWHNPADTDESAFNLAQRWKGNSAETELQYHPPGNFTQLFGAGTREIIMQEILTKYVKN